MIEPSTTRRRLAAAGLAALALAAAAGASAAPRTAETSARPAAKRLDARTRARLTSAFRTTMAQTWAPGMIAGVWIGNKGWTAVRGFAGRTARRPTLRDHTRIGSVTTTFTTTLVLQLVDEGLVSLDDTIERWFPTLAGADRITVRELGDMSSGVASYAADPSLVERYLTHPETVWTPAELIAAGTRLARAFPPGEGFLYSNTNTLMLGQIVEQVTGRPLAEVMQARLFGPLGMRHTSYPRGSAIPSPFWRGFTLQGADGTVRDATQWSPTFAGAAGQVISTLEDMHRWTRALGSGALLGRETRRARVVPNAASVAGGRAYAFGVGIDHGWRVHGGELPGYTTKIGYLPSRKATIVVLANTDIPGDDGNPAEAVFRALAGAVAPGNRPTG